jgi:hypothetical protein
MGPGLNKVLSRKGEAAYFGMSLAPLPSPKGLIMRIAIPKHASEYSRSLKVQSASSALPVAAHAHTEREQQGPAAS